MYLGDDGLPVIPYLKEVVNVSLDMGSAVPNTDTHTHASFALECFIPRLGPVMEWCVAHGFAEIMPG